MNIRDCRFVLCRSKGFEGCLIFSYVICQCGSALGWRSGESTGFDTSHVEFLEFLKEASSSGDENECVGSSLSTEKFFPGYFDFPRSP